MRIKKYELLLFLIFAIVTFVLVWHHEPFRDEAQKWLIARDCNFFGIIQMAGYEGHPTLWTFMLVPFAKSGFPIFSIQVLNWAIMCMAIYVFITKSPFHIAIKYAFCCSNFIFFEYTVVARNYCLVIFGLMLFATLFKKRNQNILLYSLTLLLLSQSQVLLVGVVGGAAFLQILQYKNFKLSQHSIFFSTVIFGLVLLFYQVKRPADAIFSVNISKFTFQNLISGANTFAQIMVYLLNPIPVKWYFLGFTIVPIIYLFKIKKLYVLLLCIFLLPLFIVHTFVYSFNAWHSYLPFIFIMLIVWITLDENNLEKVQMNKNILYGNFLIFLILFVSVFYNFRFLYNEIARPFSASKEAAQIIIQKQYHKTYYLIGESDYGISPILVYLPSTKVYHPSYDTLGTYARWRYNNKNPSTSSSCVLPIGEVIIRSNNFYDTSKQKLLIVQKSCFDKSKLISNHLKIIDSTASSVFGAKDESYYFVELKH